MRFLPPHAGFTRFSLPPVPRRESRCARTGKTCCDKFKRRAFAAASATSLPAHLLLYSYLYRQKYVFSKIRTFQKRVLFLFGLHVSHFVMLILSVCLFKIINFSHVYTYKITFFPQKNSTFDTKFRVFQKIPFRKSTYF